MKSTIKDRPTKEDRQRVLRYKLAMVITKDSERILIGTEEDIKRRLDGQSDVELEYDEVRPFGTLLLSMDKDPEGDWGTILSRLVEAQEIHHSFNVTKSATIPEKNAQQILVEKYDSGDPICQFVAMRIWYGYWAFREERKGDNCSGFLRAMHNLIRPFSGFRGYAEEQVRVNAENSIFRRSKEFYPSDREQVIYHINSIEKQDCVIIDNSLIPLERYYVSKFDKWKKYIVRCKICKRLFFADNLRYELCSEECRNQARLHNLDLRKKDEDISEIDRICNNAAAHWYNRLKKMKSSAEFTNEQINAYKQKKNSFLKEKCEKRQEYKKGKISYEELRDWLLHQEVEAQNALEDIWLHKGDTNSKP